MRKQALVAILVFSLFATLVSADIIDYYGIDNYSSAGTLDGNHPSADDDESAYGQSFNATQTMDLTSVWFYLNKFGNPAGNAHAILYGHNGVYGTSSTPNATALATSDNFNVATLNGTATLREFIFTGANIRELQAGTQYCIALVMPAAGIDNANYVRIMSDGTAPTHSGNAFYYDNAAWHAYNTQDTIFYMFDPTAVAPEHIANISDTTFRRDEAGWVNITVRDWNHIANLDYMEIQVNTTGDAESFTLRWTRATGIFSEQSDPNDICLLNTSTRVDINPWTAQICFNFTMTGGTSGYCDVRAYTIDNATLTDTDIYASQFEFVYYSWDEQVYEWIDSAFSQFGVYNYMTQITAFLNGLSAYFNDSLTHLLALVVQQFRVITNVYNFAVFWITELIGVALDFSVFYQSVLDGTSGWGTGIGDFWEVLEYDLWAPIVPLMLFLWWMESLAKRGAQTVGGELQVFINDMNTAISILSYFVSMFSLVVNTIIDRAYGLFDAIV